MAAQVLSGSGNISYTNNTGQNVRLVINWLHVQSGSYTVTGPGISKEFNVSSGAIPGSVGKTVRLGDCPFPLEIALANGDTFAITHTDTDYIYMKGHNIIVIPEAG